MLARHDKSGTWAHMQKDAQARGLLKDASSDREMLAAIKQRQKELKRHQALLEPKSLKFNGVVWDVSGRLGLLTHCVHAAVIVTPRQVQLGAAV